MQIIMITGGAGAGKTHLLESLQVLLNVFMIDPLAVDVISAKTWRQPPADTSIVAFDHLSKLKNASAQVEEAITWCKANDVTLYLIDQKRTDIEALATDIAGTAVELNLDSAYSLRVNGKCAELGDQMLAASCLIDLVSQGVTR